MEVLKDGTQERPEDWKKTVSCEKFDKYDREGCGAEYSIDATDLVLRYFRGTHFQHFYTAIQCEQCEKFTRVYDVPSKIVKGLSRAAATFDGFSD